MTGDGFLADENIDFSTYKVRDLKKYLREHGMPVSGSKPELLSRARGTQTLKIKPLSQLRTSDRIYAENRQAGRFITPLGERIPDPRDVTGWTKNISLIPSFTESELYNYLVLNDTRTFDGKPVNAKRQLKAKVFYTDRHLHSAEYNNIDGKISHCYVRAMCIRSYAGRTDKENIFQYRVWTCLSKVSGKVHSAGCECDAGEGEACNHIAALMYGLVDITEKKKEGLDVCTSVECQWNQPPRSKKLSPKKLNELSFKKQKLNSYKREVTKQHTEDKEPYQKTYTPLNMERFANKINPHAAILLSHSELLCKFKRPEKPAQDENYGLPLPPFMFRQNVDLQTEIPKCAFREYVESLHLTITDCELIEKSTRQQSKNKNWKAARSDRITSSNFGAIFKRRCNTTPTALLKSVLGYTEFDCAALRWGRNHEAAARRVYLKNINSIHKCLKLSECGFLTNTEYPYLGSSPDALIQCDHCDDPFGTLEIKCPFKYRMLSPQEAAQNKDFFCELVGGTVQLKKNHDYYYQIQGQMGISGRKWCHFFVWTLQGFSIEKVNFDEGLWKNMVVKLKCFFTDIVVPELFTRRIKMSGQ